VGRDGPSDGKSGARRADDESSWVVFVSKRVGNVQHHAQWFTLLDELWVR
jgi:hypothetical protein